MSNTTERPWRHCYPCKAMRPSILRTFDDGSWQIECAHCGRCLGLGYSPDRAVASAPLSKTPAILGIIEEMRAVRVSREMEQIEADLRRLQEHRSRALCAYAALHQTHDHGLCYTILTALDAMAAEMRSLKERYETLKGGGD